MEDGFVPRRDGKGVMTLRSNLVAAGNTAAVESDTSSQPVGFPFLLRIVSFCDAMCLARDDAGVHNPYPPTP